MSNTITPEIIELVPEHGKPRQLFILLHGVGARAADMMPLALQLQNAFPDAAVLIPEGFLPFDGADSGRQWFSIRGVTEANRAERVAGAMPALVAFVKQQHARFNMLPGDTALAGFSQGAIMALELSAAHDGLVGRVLAFSGRYASLPSKPADLTTLHLFHGSQDPVMPVDLVKHAFEHLMNLQADATLDIAAGVGHDLHPALTAQATHRLQTCVPLRMWKQAL
jgi:phospholipase/carboxylesterase